MNIDGIDYAMEEAQRFLTAAKAAVEIWRQRGGPKYSFGYSKETAACRRVSMDLTRALAKLRKP